MRPIEISPTLSYIEGLYASEDVVLQQIRERLVNANRWGVNIGASEGKILQFLIQLGRVEKAVEIGTLFGYSAVWMARALPANGHLYTIERDHESARQAKKAFEDAEVHNKVSLCEGEAMDCLAGLVAKGPFDLVFIDANKSAYVEYLDWAFTNLKTGGLIIADNTLLGGHVIHAEKPESLSNRQYHGMREFNERLARSEEFVSVILPTAEGLSIAIKR